MPQKNLSILNTSFDYKREDLVPGILHFSTGNFHRAHQAAYYHDLFNAQRNDKDSLRWGVRECSVRCGGSYTEETRPALEKQDYLYTLVELDDSGAKSTVVGSIMEMLPYHQDHQPIKEALMDDRTKIISMTVTEGGYFLNPATNELDTEHEDIQYDVNNPDNPQTVFGLIVDALKKRRQKNQEPFTVMSCDNVPGNGNVARQATVGLAKLIDGDLAKWIQDHVEFPNSMVDRITPASTDELGEYVKVNEWDYKDDAIVFCEPFRQWVCEDKFCNNQRPALEKVGVKFVDDVTPYENMKLRILNGGHASLCYPAALLDIEYVDQAMDNETICQFIDKLQKTSIVPHVPPVPDTDLHEYWETVKGRYKNSKLSDRIDRNCDQGSERQPKFILPSLVDCLESDTSVRGLATVSAMWCRFCQGNSESGRELEVNDALEDITEIAQKAKQEPQVWLDMDVYGKVGQNKDFQEAFADALRIINSEGVEAAMIKFIEEK